MPETNEEMKSVEEVVGEIEGKEEDIQPVKDPEAVKLQEDVKEAIKDRQQAGVIRKRVVEALVEEEVTSRAELLTKALAKRKAQAKELDKIRPDNVGHNVDGSKAFEAFSKTKLVERQKVQKVLSKIDNAINAAVNRADYDGLKKITQ